MKESVEVVEQGLVPWRRVDKKQMLYLLDHDAPQPDSNVN